MSFCCCALPTSVSARRSSCWRMRSTTWCTARFPGYVGFAVGPPSWAVWPLFAVYGVYVAATEGAARAWIADRMGESLAGTAYGVFSAATGAALLAASVTAGLLWSHVSHAAPFALGAVSAVAALGLLTILRG